MSDIPTPTDKEMYLVKMGAMALMGAFIEFNSKSPEDKDIVRGLEHALRAVDNSCRRPQLENITSQLLYMEQNNDGVHSIIDKNWREVEAEVGDLQLMASRANLDDVPHPTNIEVQDGPEPQKLLTIHNEGGFNGGFNRIEINMSPELSDPGFWGYTLAQAIGQIVDLFESNRIDARTKGSNESFRKATRKEILDRLMTVLVGEVAHPTPIPDGGLN